MATNTNEKKMEIVDLSGGVQRNTTLFFRAANEIKLSINATYQRLGGIEKGKGTSLVGDAMSTTTSTSTSTSTTTSSSSTSSSSTTTA